MKSTAGKNPSVLDDVLKEIHDMADTDDDNQRGNDSAPRTTPSALWARRWRGKLLPASQDCRVSMARTISDPGDFPRFNRVEDWRSSPE